MDNEKRYTEAEISQIVIMLKGKGVYCSPDSANDCFFCPDGEVCQSVFDEFNSNRK